MVSIPGGAPIIAKMGKQLNWPEDGRRLAWESDDWIIYEDGEVYFKTNGTRYE